MPKKSCAVCTILCVRKSICVFACTLPASCTTSSSTPPAIRASAPASAHASLLARALRISISSAHCAIRKPTNPHSITCTWHSRNSTAP